MSQDAAMETQPGLEQTDAGAPMEVEDTYQLMQGLCMCHAAMNSWSLDDQCVPQIPIISELMKALVKTFAEIVTAKRDELDNLMKLH